MIPNKSLVQPPRTSPYLPPKELAITDTTDVALGGVGLSNPTQGLQYQNWNGYVTDVGLATSAVYLKASNTPDTFIFSSPNITWMRFTFDQNMHPFIFFSTGAASSYFWWDPLLPGNTITAMPAGIVYGACVLDDPRDIQTRLGTGDVIIGYVNATNLCYRQQRDRYSIEYTLFVNIQDILANPFVNKIGRNAVNRLQFELVGNLYQ